MKVDRIKDFEAGDLLKLDGTEAVSFVRQQVLKWSGLLPQIGYETTVTVDNQWQITLEGYGHNLAWDAATHTLIGY